MAITASMVKELRERTSAGMMDCKKALVESDGDMDKAIEWLREKGLSQAAKKASRIAAEGVVAQYTNDNGSVGVIVEINCETDFVARTDNFLAFCKNVAKHIALAKPADVDELLGQILVKRPLHEYGVEKEELKRYTQTVLTKQGRLTANNYTTLDETEILHIYEQLF